MNTHTPLLLAAAVAAAFCIIADSPAYAQTSTTSGGSATGGSARSTGGSATGGSAVGGNATATGGSATGGSATGGSAVGGSATGGSVTPGTATTNVGDREITASASSASVHGQGSTAWALLDDHVVTVERERLLVDSKEQAKIPASARKVRITLADARLTVVADGKQVLDVSVSN